MMRDEAYLAVMRKRIRGARLAKGLRQEDVAERVNMPLRSYQRFEAQHEKRLFNPTLFNLLAVARAIGVDLCEFTCEPSEAELKGLEESEKPGRARRVKNP